MTVKVTKFQRYSAVFTYDYVLIGLGLGSNDRPESLNRLCYIHSNVCHSVLRECEKDGHELPSDCIYRDDFC